jgi:hypothetical protein
MLDLSPDEIETDKFVQNGGAERETCLGQPAGRRRCNGRATTGDRSEEAGYAFFEDYYFIFDSGGAGFLVQQL